jgi:CRP/FNR family transcriptional regulator, anaerobic regulatory protein
LSIVLTLVESQSPVVSNASGKAAKASVRSGDRHALAAGELLFREGEARTQAYRIESGAICLFSTRADGANEILKFAFPGDVVGLGYLDRHAASAQAAMDTTLCPMPRTAIESAAEARSHTLLPPTFDGASPDDEPLLRQDAVEPVQRVVALFVTLSRHNGYEGRDPNVITDSLKCGTVAGHLDMSLDVLAEQLAELEARGLVEPCDEGLRLLDLEELERLADGPLQ